MTTVHNLGFPRIGAKRELKFALESYWKGESSRDELFHSINVTWDNHEGDGRVAFQQWDGTKWNVISDWIAPDWKLLRPIIVKSSLAYAKEKNIKVRTSIND